jgi:hypothetical protein
MWGSGIEDEVAAFCPRVGYNPVCGDMVALQQIKEVLLSRTTVKTSRYVSIDEQGLYRKVQKVGKACRIG